MLSPVNSRPARIFLLKFSSVKDADSDGYSKNPGFHSAGTAIALESEPGYSAQADSGGPGVHFCGPCDMLSPSVVMQNSGELISR